MRRATSADIAKLTQVLARAFDQDPFINWFVIQDAQRATRFEATFQLILRRMSGRLNETFTTAALDGCAVWKRPGQYAVGGLEQLSLLPGFARAMGWSGILRFSRLLEHAAILRAARLPRRARDRGGRLPEALAHAALGLLNAKTPRVSRPLSVSCGRRGAQFDSSNSRRVNPRRRWKSARSLGLGHRIGQRICPSNARTRRFEAASRPKALAPGTGRLTEAFVKDAAELLWPCPADFERDALQVEVTTEQELLRRPQASRVTFFLEARPLFGQAALQLARRNTERSRGVRKRAAQVSLEVSV